MDEFITGIRAAHIIGASSVMSHVALALCGPALPHVVGANFIRQFGLLAAIATLLFGVPVILMPVVLVISRSRPTLRRR